MAGLYIHVPFCRKACHYCDFHFSTSHKLVPEMVDALVRELELAPELAQWPFETVYFGGGTPSLLTTQQLGRILEKAAARNGISPLAEVTLEANPDDITPAKVSVWKSLGINRLSIGIQSFEPRFLHWMNRAHTADQAIGAIRTAQIGGIDNITIDLIFGLPDQSLTDWENELKTAIGLGVQHLSCYSLTVEERTALGHAVKRGQQAMPPDSLAAEQYLLTYDLLTATGFDAYELSNYGKPGFHSRHNSAYWNHTPYLGIGPSAHSFDGQTRWSNVRSNAGYTRAIAKGELPREYEQLTIPQKLNELIMLGLRRSVGLNLALLEALKPNAGEQILLRAQPFIRSAHLDLCEGCLKLTRSGRVLADHITGELFFESV